MRWTTWRLFSELSRDNMGTFLLFQNVRDRFVHGYHPFLWNSVSESELRYHFDSDLSFDFYINKATRLALHYLNYKRIYIYIRLENSTHPFFPCLSGVRPPSPQPAPQAYPGQHYSVPRLAGRCNLSRVSWVCPVLPLGHAWNTPEVPRRHLSQMPKPPQQSSVRAGKVWFTKAVLANGTGTALILDHFNSWLHTEHSK